VADAQERVDARGWIGRAVAVQMHGADIRGERRRPTEPERVVELLAE
jgi:hypothetical protein